MLRDDDVDAFLDELELDVRLIVETSMSNEDWPSDDVRETKAAIERLSEKLDSDENRRLLTEVDPALLCGLLAMLSMPRSFLALRGIAEAAPAKMNLLLSPDDVGHRVAALHMRTLLMRISHIKRMDLVGKIFSSERQRRIIDALERMNDDNPS